MENAVNAVNKLFAKDSTPSRDVDTTVDADRDVDNTVDAKRNVHKTVDADRDVDNTVEAEVAPAVEHTHVKKQHETREQKFVEKERHQDHYHTTVQPLKDTEVKAEKHDHTQETKHKSINHDDGGAKAKAESDRAGFKSTSEEKQSESKTQEPTQEEEHVHHHLHETIQPVIEKEVIEPSVTHKRVDVKEKIQEPSEHHGVTTKSAIPVEEFKKKLDGQKQ
ncbi:hypothetical protein BP5796_02056 [Coleophoma crateriformis]|uniref:Allergen n=1 Tax=Coleophoma crateriformis TaxID=565419 RepID=A0A3D8T260_9HELO|nr:hypothetical protein BP5796_02056 [Coleophoma crateriformis]